MSDDLFAGEPEGGEAGPPKPSEVGGGAGGEGSAVPGEGAGAGAGYRETQSVYAARYGMSVRAIKGWISEGRAAGKLPPLDDPEAMLVWWHEVKTNRAPSRLLAAAEEARRTKIAETPKSAEPPAAAAATSGAGTVSEEKAPEPKKRLVVGFAASLDRVRVAEAEANERYLLELAKQGDDRNEALISRLRKEWGELSQQLRFLEKSAPEVLAKSGEILYKADVRRLLGEMHSSIVAGVRSLLRRVRQQAPANATLDDLERLYSEGVEKLFARLVSSEFAPDK